MVGHVVDVGRGVLYPSRMPRFHRLTPPQDAAKLVAWFWVPEWDIEPGRTSRQHVVAYPALNLVVQVDGVELVGPTTTATHRDLSGRGWAVGALLHPAAAATLAADPGALRDSSRTLDALDLHDGVLRAMESGGDGYRERAADAFSRWLIRRVGEIGPEARQANAMSEMLMGDDAVTRPEEAAARLAMSVRTLQRLCHRYVGLPPAAMIRRRRLQEAAQRIRDDPDASLSVIAAELGYVDQAHLTNDFRAVLGVTPRNYRSGAG